MTKPDNILKLMFLLTFTSLFSANCFAQNLHEDNSHWRIAPLIGHTYVALEKRGNHTPIASWGLDLEYWVNHKWGIGLHNDLEIESFIIEQEENELIERHYPLVGSLDLLIRPWRELVMFFGPGVEFDRNETFSLVRIGAEYEFILTETFDLSPAFFYDGRIDAFNTWTFGLGVGYRF